MSLRVAELSPNCRLTSWQLSVDTLSVVRRSDNMRRIRSTGTKPELAIRKIVRSLGYRFRLHVASLPGKPDIVVANEKKIIEVCGCFWHQHKGCIDSHIPKTRRAYWRSKLSANCKRDQTNLRRLRRLGWKVLRIWECGVWSP